MWRDGELGRAQVTGRQGRLGPNELAVANLGQGAAQNLCKLGHATNLAVPEVRTPDSCGRDPWKSTMPGATLPFGGRIRSPCPLVRESTHRCMKQWAQGQAML